jgi:competence protein ComFC
MFVRDFLDVFSPFQCLCCGDTFFYNEIGGEPSLSLCGDCMLLVPKVLRTKKGEGIITKKYILSSYDGPLGFVLRAAKYGHNLPLMYSLGKFLGQCSREYMLGATHYDGIVHVPTSTLRKYKRGFDQAEILAICVSQFTNIPKFSYLKRIDPSEQSKKIGKERLDRKLRFQAREMKIENVLLIDDVCTSGNTLQQCSQELLCCGAKEVHTLSLLSRQI